MERKFTFNFPSAAISYAMILPASGKKVYFQFPERSYILCNDIASERKEGKKVYFLFPERSYIICKDTAKNLISLNIKPL